MMIKFAIFLGVLAIVNTTPVQKCSGNPNNLFKSVTISNGKEVCTKFPCILYSGKDVEAKIDFSVKKEVKNFKVLCKASVMGMTIDYPIPGGDHGCNFLNNTQCPIKANTDAQMTVKMKILPNVPKIKVNLQIFSLDQNKEMINCFQFVGKII